MLKILVEAVPATTGLPPLRTKRREYRLIMADTRGSEGVKTSSADVKPSRREGRFGRRRLLAGAALTGVATAGAAAGCKVATTAVGATKTPDYDVVVVGAGLAGLTAATTIAKAGHSVIVLEARDRVGGRTYDVAVAPGVVVELGGEWTGPGQSEVQALARRLGVRTFPTYGNGQSLYYRSGRLKTYAGALPPTSSQSSTELLEMISKLNRMAKDVPAFAPWNAPVAAPYDAQTVGGWIAAQGFTEETTFLAGLAVRGVYGEEASQISLMDFLGEITGVGGDLLTAIGSAQSIRFVGGPQQLAKAIAGQLNGRVRLSCPVSAIQQGDTATVHSAGGAYRGRRVIVTVPKSVTAAILFEPALPAAFAQYFQRQPSGATVKIQAVYDTPFWRHQGLNGSVISDTGPVEVVYDNSPVDGPAGVLVGFAEGNEGRSLFALSQAQRQRVVLTSLARYFGRQAEKPTHYIDMVWADDPFAGGAYGSFNPPGVITSLGAAVNGPAGNIYFAGADYSSEWPGYMEGAIRSGDATANLVLKTL